MKFTGIVKKHLGRGKKLGFPTANIEAPKEIEDGLFLAFTEIASKKYPSILFVGASQTFDETDRRAESYVLDFSGDLYGQEIEIEIVKKLRDNKKFDSQKALIEQMKKDEKVAKEFFKDYNLDN